MINFENNLYEENNNLNTNVACALNNNACRGKSDWSAAGGRRASATYTCRRQGLDRQWQGCRALATYAMGKVHIFEYW